MKARKWLLDILKILFISCFASLLIPSFLFAGGWVTEQSGKLFSGNWLEFSLAAVSGLLLLLCVLVVNRRLGFGRRYYDNGFLIVERYLFLGVRWNPFLHLLFVIVNCMVAFYIGFLVGGEAPSVMLGASVGLIANLFFRSEDKCMVQGAMSASLCIAHMNPLAGLAHLYEEHKKHLSLRLFLVGVPIVGISYGLSWLVRKLIPYHVLHVSVTEHLPFSYYPLLLVIVVLSAVIGKLYLIAHHYIRRSAKIIKWMDLITLGFGIGYMVLKRFCPVLTGSGVEYIGGHFFEQAWWIVAGILLFRTLNTAVSYRASVSGGVVLPIFALGSIVGDLVVSIFENTGLFPELATFIPLFCMIGLLTTFAAASDLFLVSFALVLNTDVQYAVLPLALTLGVTKLLMLGLNKVMYKFKFYDTEEENEEIL